MTTASMRITANAVKFLAQSRQRSKPKNGERQGVPFLKGVFTGPTDEGREDAKRVLNAWFVSRDDEDATMELGGAGFGVLLIGSFSMKEPDSGDGPKIKSLSNCRLARYNSEGSFKVREGDREVVYSGKPGEYVTFEVHYETVLVTAEETSEVYESANGTYSVDDIINRLEADEANANADAQRA